MERIFVQIASYRDPECRHTIDDLFAKASSPERISIGLCLQYDETSDKDCLPDTPAHEGRLRMLVFHPSESKGSGWAHAQAQSLWDGEEYVLQIHAHMRFEQGWDETLIGMLARCPSAKPAIASNPPGYTPPHTFHFRDESRASFVRVHEVSLDTPAIITLHGALVDKNEAIEHPRRTPFWTGPFLFAHSDLFRDVPFDPGILFHGEPLAYSARLFTHGWDLFEPDQLVVFHWWGRDFVRPYRDPGTDARRFSEMRVRHVLRLQAAPASGALTGIDDYGLGSARSVDDFWLFAGIDPMTGSISEEAREGRWDASFAKLLRKPPAQGKALPRIFVQIASYRDPECQWTVKDIFDKAKYPDRVFVGICWQFDAEADKDCFVVQVRPEQVRMLTFDCQESRGVCWARHQTQKLWQGEEYTLMIDSHMRFEFDWDEKLIADLALCRSSKSVLSNYPAAYTPPHDLEKSVMPVVQRPDPYHGGDVRFRGESLDHVPERPLRGAFVAAGLIFAKSDIIREVPYDPYLYFNQEELSLAARLYTHGWDVYSMRRVLVYHLYVVDPAKKKRRLHWEDSVDWGQMNDRGRLRMDVLMGFAESDDPLIVRDLMKYELGDVRTLAEFSAFCGIDFKNRVVNERALRCEFIEDLAKYKDERVHVPDIDGPPTPKAERQESALRLITVDCNKMTGWKSFHSELAGLLQFIEPYEATLESLAQRMAALDDVTPPFVRKNGLVVLRLEKTDIFRARNPELWTALERTIGIVNAQRQIAGKEPLLALMPIAESSH